MGLPCLNIQVNLFPLFNGGFYFTVGHGQLNRMIRLALCVVDIRFWWQGLGGPPPSPAVRFPPGEFSGEFVPTAAVMFPPGMFQGPKEVGVWRCPTCGMGFGGGPPAGVEGKV